MTARSWPGGVIAALVALHATVFAAAPEHRVEPAAYEALAAAEDGRTYVVVVLRGNPEARAGDLRRVRAEVTQLQTAILDDLPAGAFEPVYRYENFAAMTGYVTSEGLDALAMHPDVVAVGPDARGGGNLDVSVPFIGADTVQDDLGFTGAGVTVAVLDTGIDTDHPDLSDDIAPGAYHFLDQGATVGPGAEDDNGHGSNVSGIITAKGVVSSRGVAPDTDILAVKVLDATNSGWLSDWTAGVDYVVTQASSLPHLCAINMSLGSFTLYSDCPCDAANAFNLTLGMAIQAAEDAGMVTFCSSGNNGSTTSMSAPACLASPHAVAAVYDQDLGRQPPVGTYADIFGSGFGACYDATTGPDVLACFSNRSACNELAGPGRSIAAPYAGGGVAAYTGTSQAAPHVTGVAALMRDKGRFATLEPDQVVGIMKSTGVVVGGPPNIVRVNARAAVDATPQGVPAAVEGAWLAVATLLVAAGALAVRRKTA